jgi:glycerol 3-phosphatase-2
MTGYDCLFVDLDGVVYRGPGAVLHAVDALTGFDGRVVFVTNNASRTPAAVAGHLRGLGLAADESDIVTSAQAAAAHLATLVPPGSAVLVTGGAGLREAVAEQGLVAASGADEAAAVIQGYSPDLGWRDLAEAAYALTRDIPWVASNTDLTVPTARGIAPGNGTLVAAVASATGRTPVVTGKPHRPIMDLARARARAERPLVVGDRLDTDIAAATAAGMDSLLVLTGVTVWQDLLAAPPEHLPTMVAPDLRFLHGYRDQVTQGLNDLLRSVREGRATAQHERRLHQLAQTQQVAERGVEA